MVTCRLPKSYGGGAKFFKSGGGFCRCKVLEYKFDLMEGGGLSFDAEF